MYRLLLSGFLLIFCTVLTTAKPYHVPEENIKEMRYYRQLMTEHPTSSNVKFELAMRYAYSGFIQEGWDLLKELPAAYSDEVVETYEAAVSADVSAWKPRFKLAFGYYFQERTPESLAMFKSVLEHKPNHPWTMGFIALIEGLEAEGDAATESAIMWCKKALAIEPNATAIHLLLAEGFRRKGEIWASMGHLMKAGQLLTKEKLSDEFLDES